jgi:hypothetical protein
MNPERAETYSTGVAPGTQPLGHVWRELAAELVGLIRRDHHVAAGARDKANRVGWNVVAVILGALVAYTGLMFLLWGGIVGLWIALTGAGIAEAPAACAAFLVMGAVWSLVGFLVAHRAIGALRREPIETDATDNMRD